MTDLASVPSSLLKTLARVARICLGLVLGAWLAFLGVWGALHWIIVPRIDDFRPLLEDQASRVLGLSVRIGAVSAQSTGLVPSFELSQVRFLDAQGREALRLPRVVLALSPRSLLDQGFEQLYVDQPELDIRRAADGRIFVAGLEITRLQGSDPAVADWFFSQREFVIHQGRVRWTDELRRAPALALGEVNLLVRNAGRRHDLRLDATPPPAWGERFSLQARLQQPLLSLQHARWRQWSGQLFADFSRVDLSELRRYADLGVDLVQGNGALRAWVDVDRAQASAVIADLALGQVVVRLGADLQPLTLRAVQGRLGARLLANGLDFSSRQLSFDTPEGLQWRSGELSLNYLGTEGAKPARGELKVQDLDLATLTRLADRLPLAPEMRQSLQAYAPKGQVQQMSARWQGPLPTPASYELKGRITGLEWLARPAVAPPAGSRVIALGVPGLQGAVLDFDVNQSSGRAELRIEQGAMDFPGLFEESLVPLAQLSTDIKWQIAGDRIAVQLPNLKFSNADAQGEAQVKWERRDPRTRSPGSLDLQASLSRGQAARVHRYLPLTLGRSVREYVRQSVSAGVITGARFRVKGELDKFPFADARQGQFTMAADLQNLNYAYVPRYLQPPEAAPWPALGQLHGELVIDRNQLQLKGVRARLGTGVQVLRADALIPELKPDLTVLVSGDLRGPVTEALATVASSPLASITQPYLGGVVASGLADYRLKLELPLARLEQSSVQGSVTLAGNDVQLSPDLPRLGRVRGAIAFTEGGFSLSGLQARLLGGEARLDGGAAIAASGPQRGTATWQLRASGSASAESLRQARELGLVARLAERASGSTSYTASFSQRQGQTELLLTSSLQGMALDLPAPLNKAAETVLPLRLEMAPLREANPAGPLGTTGLRARDQLTLELGRLVSAAFVRDVSGAEPRVIRGSLGVGLTAPESAPMPEQGVLANISLGQLDVDEWSEVFTQITGGNSTVAPGRALASTYLPNRLAIRARELTLEGRRFRNVVIGGSREGQLWRANLDAGELNGYLEYRQPAASGAGRLFARLARLSIQPATATDVENLLSEPPTSIPSLDVVVDDFELRGKRLGRLEMEAVNRTAAVGAADAGPREWRMTRLNLSTPEAVLSATGNWALVNAQGAMARGSPERRRTVMNFRLDVSDAGELLARLGMKDVLRRGRGKLEGQVAWLGSPLTLDYPSMGGSFTVGLETGQFIKAEPGIAKLLGVLSLQALPRRLSLDFRDVFSEGFVFDSIRGDVVIEQGLARTNNLQMKGVNAVVLMEGRADIARETQDIKAVVIPEINAGTASIIASVVNPAVGLGTFLAQLFLRRPLMEAATQEFHIDGSWADPKVARVDRRAAKPPVEAAP